MSDFLKKDYTVPQSNQNYFKFQQGQNSFRILSSAVIGFEYWNTSKKPVRSKEQFTKKPIDVRLKDDNTWQQKHFWAFIIWNYDINAIQIMQITQKTIMNQVKAYVDNDKWGNPQEYDLVITKTGEGLETEYNTVANPKTDVQQEIMNELKAKPANLEALYTGADPFSPSEQTKTQEQIDEEAEVLKACDKL